MIDDRGLSAGNVETMSECTRDAPLLSRPPMIRDKSQEQALGRRNRLSLESEDSREDALSSEGNI